MSETITHGMRRLAVYDPATGTTVHLGDLDAEAFEFEKQTPEPEDHDPQGGGYFPGDNSRLFARFLDPTGALSGQLEAWRQAGVKVSVVGEGASQNVQWYERDRLAYVRPVPVTGFARGRADMYEFEIAREGRGRHNIQANVNLLAFLGWEDLDGDGVADGYTLESGVSNSSFSAGQQTFTTDNGGLVADLVYPLAGGTFTASIDLLEGHASGEENIRHLLYDASGGLITFADTPVSAGRANVIFDVPAQTHRIELIFIRVYNDTGADAVTVADPALRTDGSDVYLPY